MAAKFKYCLGGGELVIKDMKAEPATYEEGQVVEAAEAGEAGVKSYTGTQTVIAGVSNQGETLPSPATLSAPGITVGNDGAVLTGTTALGTIENLKVIVNSDAVYGVDYYIAGVNLTCTAAVDTQIDLTTGGGGYNATIAGYWIWDLTTGELNWVVATVENVGTLEAEVVAGNSTGTADRVLLLPSQNGALQPISLNTDGLTIDQVADLPVAGTNAVNGVVLENRLESFTYGSEILNPNVHNNQVRFPNTLTTEQDRTKAVAYVNFATNLA